MLPVPLKVFLSSPGDVTEERRSAREIIQRLQHAPLLVNQVALQVVAWDSPDAPVPLSSGESPQDSVNRYQDWPEECDLTVVILWSRLGTPLSDQRKADGTPYRSGTEWEYENARAQRREVWVYQRTEEPSVKLRDPLRREKEAQYEAVLGYLAELRAQGGINAYASAAQFAEVFEKHLEAFIRTRSRPAVQRRLRPRAPESRRSSTPLRTHPPRS